MKAEEQVGKGEAGERQVGEAHNLPWLVLKMEKGKLLYLYWDIFQGSDFFIPDFLSQLSGPSN